MAARDLKRYGVAVALAVGAFAWAATDTFAQQFVMDGLKTMYTLDEADIDGDTVLDVIGTNHATLMGGGPVFVDGVVDECAEFDASSGYIEIPDLGLWPAVTLECWAMEHAFGGIQGIVSTWQWEAGKVHFKFEGGEIQVDKNGGSKIRLAAAEENRWYHIVYSSEEDSGELKLYVDGELVAEGAGGANPENMVERRIGSEHDGRFLDGKVDEVRIYDRILTEDEVAQNFGVDSNTLTVDPAGKVAMTWGRLKDTSR